MNPDETGLKRVSGIRASYINADEHFVYFESNDLSAASGLGGLAVPSIGIFKMNHGGGKSGNIVRENVRGLTLIGNNIYYVKDTKETGITFNSMDVNKKEEILLLKQEVNPGCTDGRNIYFTNFATDMGLYRYDVTTGGMSMLTAEKAYNPQIQGEYIYYMDIAKEILPQDLSNEFNTFEIMYKKEIKLGETVRVYYSKVDDWNYVTIKSEDEKKLYSIIRLK